MTAGTCRRWAVVGQRTLVLLTHWTNQQAWRLSSDLHIAYSKTATVRKAHITYCNRYWQKWQVCVQLLRMLKTLHCPHSLAACTLLLQQSIDISCRPVHAAAKHAGTDRRTDTVLLHRPCWAYHAGSANDAVLRCYQQVPFYGDYNMSSSACSYWLQLNIWTTEKTPQSFLTANELKMLNDEQYGLY